MKTATFETSKGTIVADLFDEETPKTVENQLGRVYIKLGVSSRRALGDALASS